VSEGEIKILVEAVDEATSVLKNVARRVDELAGTTTSLKKKTTGLSSVMRTAAGVMLGEVAHDALGAVTHAASESSRGFMDYEQTLAAVVAASGETGKAAEELRASLMKVAESQADLGFNAAQATAGLESLVKAGLSGGDAAKALRSSLEMAKIEGISTAEASDMLVGVMNQFGYAASDATKVVDTLVNASIAGVGSAKDFALGLSYCGAQAASMGISLQETTAALVAMNNQGIAAEKAGRYLGAMLTDLINHSDKLGFSIYDSNGKMLSLSEIIGRLSGKLKKFGSDEERNAYLTEVFGTQSARAALTLLNMKGSLDELTETMNKEGSANQYVNQILDTTAGRLSQAQAQTENASYALGQMTAQLQLTWAQFAVGLGPIGAVANALGPSLLQGAISGVMIMLPQLIGKFGAFASVLTGPVGLAIMGAVAAGALLYEAWTNDWGGIREKVGAVINALKAAWDAFVNGLKWAWDNILVPLGKFFATVFYVHLLIVKKALEAISNALKPVIDGFKFIGDALGGFVSNLFGSPQTVFEDAAEGIKKMKKEMHGLPSFPTISTHGFPIPTQLGGNITITGPLVNVEGSVDRATAEYAAELVKEKLQSVIIENTSSNAVTKRIRVRREW